MIRLGLFGGLVFVSLVMVFPRTGGAQAVLPRAGQSFSFGVIEGPYSDNGTISGLQQTSLILTVVSAYSGCGTITSPSGYSQDFTFVSDTPTIVNLPLGLIHLNDIGKSDKGLLVRTSQPVNLVLHDYMPYGGDASQILPDGALDTSYVTCGWGIWNDPTDQEDNLDEFLITAISDSTIVTINPSVKTLLGQAKNIPFSVMLNRGECYIVKADTSDLPSDPSLSGSTIHSSAPVSVISGLTCAYVPVGIQACNELMDELIGRKWWGTHFFVQPIDPNDIGGQLVLTSNQDFLANINHSVYHSAQGRLSMQFTGSLEIHTLDSSNHPFPVEAHQLTRSYSDCDSGYGDPSLVTILDTSYYADTVLWNTPSFAFNHCISIICPTADLGRARLDGRLLSQLGVPSSVINGGWYSAINPSVEQGLHKIISPDPIFAISAGFNDADAYTFVAGSAGTRAPFDSVRHGVVLQADSARTCSEFNMIATLGPPVQTSESMVSLTLTVTYDPSTLRLMGFVPLSLLDSASYTIDSSTEGTIKLVVLGTPLITGDSLFQLIFEALKATAATQVGINGGATTMECTRDSELIAGTPFTFVVEPANPHLLQHHESATAYYSQTASLILDLDTSSLVNLDSLWPYLTEIQATYSWDSSVAKYLSYLPPNGWTLTELTNNGNTAFFNIHNTSASQSLELGTALFTPTNTQLVTSWVELPSLILEAGNQAHLLCVTNDEDNHWAITTLGAASGVAPSATLPEGEGLLVYPNPAGDEVFVQNANAVPIAIEVFDPIGRNVMAGTVAPISTSWLNIASLANGSYVLVCHIGDRTVVRRISKLE